MVYIVDDDKALLKSLRWLLESVDLNVVAFESAREFLDNFDPDTPGCLLLDVRMPSMSGLELRHILQERGVNIPTIVFTGHGDVGMAVECMKTGAFDFIEKPCNEQQLVDRVHDAIEHDQALRKRQASLVEASALYGRLTPRERELMELIVEGLPNKQSAVRLGISEKTVEVHRSRIMKKLEAKGVADVVKLALLLRSDNQ